jgi:hypothetical protein
LDVPPDARHPSPVDDLDTGGFVQFHLNGFEPGDPEIADRSQRYPASGASGSLPGGVDVLIVGCGPAGLTLAAQLSAFPDIKTCIVEQKPGPLRRGQADGIACRTMEMFEAYGFSERVLKEACWINETTFWKPDDKQRENIVRSGRVQDVEDGLSEFPHVVLNQARVHDFYLDVMRKSPARLEPYYARRLIDLEIDDAESGDNANPYQVTARLERLDPRARRTDRDGQGPLCGGLRRRAQHRAQEHWARAARRLRQSRLGRDGCPGRHRLPRCSLQVADPVRQRRQHHHHPARRRLSVSPLHRDWTSSMPAKGFRIATSPPTI